jgi:hypothetical protein
MARVSMSAAPPGGKVTMILMGWRGQACARTGLAPAMQNARNALERARNRFIVRLPFIGVLKVRRSFFFITAPMECPSWRGQQISSGIAKMRLRIA